MSSHFLFHAEASEKVPFNAQYAFPSQATRVAKSVVKIPAKNGGPFQFNRAPIRIELPADGYLDPLASYLAFTALMVTKTNTSTRASNEYAYFTKNAQCLFSRLRLLYGSMVIEDIQDVDALCRMLTDVGIGQDYLRSTGSITENLTTSDVYEAESALDFTTSQMDPLGINDSGVRFAANKALDITETKVVPGSDSTSLEKSRRFCISPLLGLLCQKKLLPLKWMASQLTIELTVNDPQNCIIWGSGYDSRTPDFRIEDVAYVAQLLEFDSSYDTAFYAGLNSTGVPLLFSSWHRHTFSLNSSFFSQQIHERSRSVKSAYAVIRDVKRASPRVDGYNFYHSIIGNAASTLPIGSDVLSAAVKEFQWRVGGRYFPSQPVKCDLGGAEAYMELLKALNVVGDYSTGNNIDYQKWSCTTDKNFTGKLAAFNSNGKPYHGGTKFIMATEFESSNGFEISGINAEEQSDVALMFQADGPATWPVGISRKVDVFVYYDCMLIVRPGNHVDLIL